MRWPSLAALAEFSRPCTQPIAESVFFDGFARTLIAWPSGFTLPAALADTRAAARRNRRSSSAGERVTGARHSLGLGGHAGYVGGGRGAVHGAAVCADRRRQSAAARRVRPGSRIPSRMHLAAAAIALLAAGAAARGSGGAPAFGDIWVAAALLGRAFVRGQRRCHSRRELRVPVDGRLRRSRGIAGPDACGEIRRRSPLGGRLRGAAARACAFLPAYSPCCDFCTSALGQPGMAPVHAGAQLGNDPFCCRCWPSPAAARSGESSRSAALIAVGRGPDHSALADLFGRLAGASRTWSTGSDAGHRARRSIWRYATRCGCLRRSRPPHTSIPYRGRASRAAHPGASLPPAPNLGARRPGATRSCLNPRHTPQHQPRAAALTSSFGFVRRAALPRRSWFFRRAPELRRLGLHTATGPVRIKLAAAAKRRHAA